MILLCGIPSEPPLGMVREALDSRQAPYLFFNQREFAKTQMSFEVTGGHVRGWIQINDRSYPLETITAVFTRLMDDRFLPELADEPEGSPARCHCRTLHQILTDWSEITVARVVNRNAPMGSNFSKPYQAQLIQAQGFAVPETLITNNPTLVDEFWRHHGSVIYKSISGVRSIVQQLHEADRARLHTIRWCPTQFQQFIAGRNVRVHVIGEEAFATAVDATTTDYRYTDAGHERPTLTAIDLSARLRKQCIDLAAALELAFAGIDLIFGDDGQIYCLEVNPCPAFSYYEAHTDQPIAQGVADYLFEAP